MTYVKRKRLTTFDVKCRLFDRDITLIGEYVNATTKCTFKCSVGHIWSTSAASIFSGCGCPICAREVRAEKLKLSPEIVESRLSVRGFTLISDYVNSAVKSEIQCSKGHRWSSTVDNVMRGSGCPFCASYGFNPNVDAEIYVILIDGAKSFCGFGITCDFDTRIKVHRRVLSNAGCHISECHSFRMSGSKAHSIESFLKKAFPIIDSGVPSFRSEAVESKYLKTLLSDIASFTVDETSDPFEGFYSDDEVVI